MNGAVTAGAFESLPQQPSYPYLQYDLRRRFLGASREDGSIIAVMPVLAQGRTENVGTLPLHHVHLWWMFA